MKKFVIKISLAFVIIAVVLLILLGLRSRDSFVPSYRFLGGPCHLVFTIHSTVLRTCFTIDYCSEFSVSSVVGISMGKKFAHPTSS